MPETQTVEETTQVAKAIAHRLAYDRYLDLLREISELELSGIIGRILEEYAVWRQGQRDKLLSCRDFLANICFRLSIPIVEMAYALYVLRDEVVAHGGLPEDTNQFFDRLALELMRRY